MASPLRSGKQSVNLTAPAICVSRIRRDPPPVVKKVSAHDKKVRDAWLMAFGIAAFALALAIIVLAVGNIAGWSLREYTIRLEF